MDTIRNYLETMFLHLPSTEEVQKAKAALLEMMEDKYNELRQHGCTENEAVGKVISEFGNLEELKETLGISEIVDEQPVETRKRLSFEEVCMFLKDRAKAGTLTAVGAALCTACAVPVILLNGFGERIGAGNGMMEILGMGLMFAMIAAAVTLFIISGSIRGRWKYVRSDSCTVDFETMNYVADEANRFSPMRTLMITVGVVLCIFCWFPAAIISYIPGADYLSPLGAALVLVFVAFAVFLYTAAGTRGGSYHAILALSDPGTVGRGAAANATGKSGEAVYFDNKVLDFIMSVYWPTITCIYLVWSFLTFSWHITWVIWPIAGLVHKIITTGFGKH